MPAKYQIFCDNLSGMSYCPKLSGNTLQECVKSITENGSPHWMHYIYVLHEEKVPYWGARPDVYLNVKAVAGRLVEPISIRHKEGLQYALTLWDGSSWLFADII